MTPEQFRAAMQAAASDCPTCLEWFAIHQKTATERDALRRRVERLEKAMRESKAKIMPVWAKLEMWRDDALLLFSAMEILDDAMESLSPEARKEDDNG